MATLSGSQTDPIRLVLYHNLDNTTAGRQLLAQLFGFNWVLRHELQGN